MAPAHFKIRALWMQGYPSGSMIVAGKRPTSHGANYLIHRIPPYIII